MSGLDLEFKPIDLSRHADLCRQFFEDTHRCSYGTLDGFDGQSPLHFSERIANKLTQDPESCLHVWLQNTVVGQINFGTFVDPATGYLSFFYAAPLWRGTGVAAEMEQFATDHFRKRGYLSARLSVTAANVRAINFYSKRGWVDLGPRADCPTTRNMEKRIGPDIG